jgi:hypothetical protein
MYCCRTVHASQVPQIFGLSFDKYPPLTWNPLRNWNVRRQKEPSVYFVSVTCKICNREWSQRGSPVRFRESLTRYVLELLRFRGRHLHPRCKCGRYSCVDPDPWQYLHQALRRPSIFSQCFHMLCVTKCYAMFWRGWASWPYVHPSGIGSPTAKHGHLFAPLCLWTPQRIDSDGI